MAKEGNANFEIPTEMRDIRGEKRGAGQAGLRQLHLGRRNTRSTPPRTRPPTARTGAKEVGELAMRFAERNIASSFEFAQRLLRAKDSQEVTALHAEYVKSQIAALTDQAKELSKQAAKMAGQGAPH